MTNYGILLISAALPRTYTKAKKCSILLVKDKENPQSFFIHCLRANRNGSCPKALGLAAEKDVS